MGIADMFAAEDRINVKFSDFYQLVRESAKAELLFNAVKCDLPHRYIREAATGEREDDNPAENLAGVLVNAMVTATANALVSRMDQETKETQTAAQEDTIESDMNKEE